MKRENNSVRAFVWVPEDVDFVGFPAKLSHIKNCFAW